MATVILSRGALSIVAKEYYQKLDKAQEKLFAYIYHLDKGDEEQARQAFNEFIENGDLATKSTTNLFTKIQRLGAMASQPSEKNSMRTKFIAFRTASETAAEAERTKQYLKAAQFWQKAYQWHQVHRMKIGAFARADYCFKAAIDTGAIKVEKADS